MLPARRALLHCLREYPKHWLSRSLHVRDDWSGARLLSQPIVIPVSDFFRIQSFPEGAHGVLPAREESDQGGSGSGCEALQGNVLEVTDRRLSICYDIILDVLGLSSPEERLCREACSPATDLSGGSVTTRAGLV